MAILKIKDKGVWKEIQAIKGDTGHDIYVGDKSKAPSEVKLIIEPVKGTATGTDIQVTDSANDKVSKLVLDGKSTQETRSGKNLLNYIDNLIPNANGLTNTINLDGSITTTGKPARNYVTIIKSIAMIDLLEDKQVYTISQEKPEKIYVQVNAMKNDGTYTYYNSYNGKASFTVDKSLYKSYTVVIQAATMSTWGDSSLTITNKYMLCKGTDTVFEKYGASPSPDYPSEIENVKGRNLFKPTLATTVLNGITCTANEDRTYTLNGTATADVTFTIGTDENLIINKTYKILGCPNGGSSTTYRIGWNYHGYEYGDGLISKKTSEVRYVQITIFKGVTVSNLIFKPMFTENTSSIYNDYVPYGNIQIVETGRNLINYAAMNNKGYININENEITIDNTSDTNIYPLINFSAPLEIGDYTSRLEVQSITLGKTCTLYVMDDKNIYTSAHSIIQTVSTETTYVASKTFTDKITKYMIVVPSKTKITLNAMLVKGTYTSVTIGNYEPYTEEVVNIDLKGNELCSLPNGTKDELIVKDGRAKIPKRIGEVILDGSDDENWGVYSEKDDYFFYSNNILKTTNEYIDGFCSHFINSKTYPQKAGYFAFRNKGNGVYFRTNGINTIADWRAWLSTHNVTVQYELAEPEEIDLGEVSTLATYEGTSNITNSEDTNMSIEYDTNKTNLYYQNNGNIIRMNEGS